MSIKDNIENAERQLQFAKQALDETPNLEAISELLDALIPVELYYKYRYCMGYDLDYQEEGTAYEEGTSMEFYIESSWWHDISKALRKIVLPESLEREFY